MVHLWLVENYGISILVLEIWINFGSQKWIVQMNIRYSFSESDTLYKCMFIDGSNSSKRCDFLTKNLSAFSNSAWFLEADNIEQRIHE